MTGTGAAAARAPAPAAIVSYACPVCHGPLTTSPAGYGCQACALQFPVTDGIPDFCPQADFYWGELTASEMDEVLARAEKQGYDAAAELASHYCPSLREYLLSPYRIDWLFHAVHPANIESCLDIGSGWGTLSRALCRFGTKVWSLEAMPRRVAFQRAFKRHEQIDELTLVRGVAHRLPFASGSFDLVVANGIIHWVGLADFSRPVQELQKAFLAECRRVLKPDGVLAVGCENRYGFGQLLGGHDHSGLPFTSVMPRKLANAVVRRFRKTEGTFRRSLRSQNRWPDYRTHTHSIRGYEKLLMSSGFGEVRSYWAYPSNNVPKFSGSVRNSGSLRDLVDYNARMLGLRGVVSRTARAAILLRHALSLPLVSSVLMKGWPDLVFLAHAMPYGNGRADAESMVGPYSMLCGGSNKLFWWKARGSAGQEVVKMVRFPRDVESFKSDESLTAEYNRQKIVAVPGAGFTLFREPMFPAVPIDLRSENDLLAAVSSLIDLQTRTRRGEWDNERLRADVERHLQKFCEMTDDRELHRLAERDCRDLSAALSSIRVPMVREHGDFTRNNLLIDARSRVYLIDWSHSRPAGDPLLDFTMLSANSWRAFPGAVARLDRRTELARRSATGAMITKFTRESGLPAELIYQYYPYTLLRRIIRTGQDYRSVLIDQFRNRDFPSIL